MYQVYTLIDDIRSIEKHFNKSYQDQFEPNYNIQSGSKSLVITSEDPHKIQLFQFGLTPSGSKSQMNIIEARTEGNKNIINDPDYSGSKAIILQPEFRKQIRTQRCLVIASAFIGISEKDKVPYLIHLDSRPFAMAGLWDSWNNPDTGEIINTYTIVTIASNILLQRISVKRMPVILSDYYSSYWLKPDTHLSAVTSLLSQYPGDKMNAYPLSSDIFNKENNHKDLLKPVGPKIREEVDYANHSIIKPRTWGNVKARAKSENDTPTPWR